MAENFDPNKNTPDSQRRGISLSEETKKELSESFINIFNQTKINVELPKSLVNVMKLGETYKNFAIFNISLQKFLDDPNFPEVDKDKIAASLINLDIEIAQPHENDKSWYRQSLDNVLNSLDKVLIPEVSLILHAFAEATFSKPFKSEIK